MEKLQTWEYTKGLAKLFDPDNFSNKHDFQKNSTFSKISDMIRKQMSIIWYSLHL